MSADTIAKLQGLLARVQRNAAQPRPVRVQAAAAAEVVAGDDVDDEVTIEQAIPESVAAQPAFETVAAASVEADGEAPEIEMGAASIEDLELLDADVVDITDEPPPVALEEAEEPPASSRRPKAAASMSEALAGAADQLDMEGREIPLKTPPPESGPQEAPPVQGLGAPPVPEVFEGGDGVDDLLSADAARVDVPTQEQLGATVDLEESSGVIEIADERPPPPPPAPPAPIEPEVTARPPVAPDAAPAAFSSRSEPKIESFLDLLDASLGL